MEQADDLQLQFHDSATVLPGAASRPSAWEEGSGSMSPTSPRPPLVVESEMVEVVEQAVPFKAKGSLVPLTESGSVRVPRDALLTSHHGHIEGRPMLKRAHTIAGDLDARFGRGSFVIVTTEANHGDHFHWFRWPTLRQEWLDEDKKVLRRDRKDRKANLMELYYDLIFVAVIGLLGHSIRLQSTLTANFFIDFIALFHIWMETLYFLDRFDSGDGVSRVLILFTMAGVVGMGMTGLEAQQQTTQRNEVSAAYAISFVWARTSIEVLYAMTLSLPNVRIFTMLHHISYLCVVAFYISSIWAPNDSVRIILHVLGFSIGLMSPMLMRFPPARWKTMLPINVEHIVERFALFSIIIIGETVVALLFLEMGTFAKNEWVATGLGLLLSFSLQWIGFDIENGTHGLTLKVHALRRGGLWEQLWIYSHIPYELSIICLAGGVWNVHHFYGALEAPGTLLERRSEPVENMRVNNSACLNTTMLEYDPILDPCALDPFFYARWLLCIGAAASLLFMTLNGAMHSCDATKHYLGVPVRVALRMAAVVFLVLIPLAGSAIDPMGYLGICCGVYAVQVIVGLEHRQAMKRMRDTLFKVSSRARVVNKDTSDLLASLKVSDSRLDMSRVLDVEFAEDHENVRLSGLDELDSR